MDFTSRFTRSSSLIEGPRSAGLSLPAFLLRPLTEEGHRSAGLDLIFRARSAGLDLSGLDLPGLDLPGLDLPGLDLLDNSAT